MKIGIDISQLAYENTGVSIYLSNLLKSLVVDENHEFILFFSSLRERFPRSLEVDLNRKNVEIKKFKYPPSILNLLWNKLHIFPIENFIGNVDVFITSDWTEPPIKKARKATILYDLIVFKKPQETDKKIIKVQKLKLNWVEKESDMVFCISESTQKDAINLLNLKKEKTKVIYPGLTL